MGRDPGLSNAAEEANALLKIVNVPESMDRRGELMRRDPVSSTGRAAFVLEGSRGIEEEKSGS